MIKEISRRAFIKVATAVLGTAVSASCSPKFYSLEPVGKTEDLSSKMPFPSPATPESSVNPESMITPEPDYIAELGQLLAEYPEIHAKIKNYEWLKAAFLTNVGLITLVSTLNEDERKHSLSDSRHGIGHLDSSYSLSDEALRFSRWLKDNLKNVSENPSLLGSSLCYLALILKNISISFHEIGTSDCFNGNFDRPYEIISPERMILFPEEDRKIMDRIKEICIKIHFETHGLKNKESMMDKLFDYTEKLEDLFDRLEGKGQLKSLFAEKDDCFHLDQKLFFSVGGEENEIKSRLRQIWQRLGIPEN